VLRWIDSAIAIFALVAALQTGHRFDRRRAALLSQLMKAVPIIGLAVVDDCSSLAIHITGLHDPQDIGLILETNISWSGG